MGGCRCVTAHKPHAEAAPSKPAKPETAAKLHVTGQRLVEGGFD